MKNRFVRFFAKWCFVEDKLDADLWLLNSCTVKSPAEDHFRNEIKHARELGKYIVLAGCVPQGQPKSEYIQVNLIVVQVLQNTDIVIICVSLFH